MAITQLDLALLGRRGLPARLNNLEGGLKTLQGGLTVSPVPLENVQAGRDNLFTNASFEFFHRGQTTAQDWTHGNGAALNSEATSADGSVTVVLPASGVLTQSPAGGSAFAQGAFALSVAVRASGEGRRVALLVTGGGGVSLGSVQRIDSLGGQVASDVVPGDGAWYRFFVSGVIVGGAPLSAQIANHETSTGDLEVDAAKFEFELGTKSYISPTSYTTGDWGGSTAIRNFHAENITTGTLTVGGNGVLNPRISVKDNADGEIVTIGDPAGGTLGIEVKGEAGILVSGDGKIVAGTPGAQRTELSAAGLAGFSATNEEQVRLASTDGKLKILGPGSVAVEGGGSLLAGVEGANRLELKEGGIFAYDVNGVEKVSISTVDGKVRVDADAFIVDGAVGFDNLAVEGSVTVGQDLTVGTNTLRATYNEQAGVSRVGINTAGDPQFALDVNGNFRASGYIVGKHAIQLPDALMICHFDGAPQWVSGYSQSPQDYLGDNRGHLGQVPYEAYGFTYVPGKFGKAIQFAGPTTNHVVNPSAEANVSSIAATNVTVTRDTTEKKYGEASFKLVGGVGGGDVWWSAGSATAGQQFTVSAWVKGTAGETVIIRGYDGVNNLGPAGFVLTGKWQRIWTTYVTGATGTGKAPRIFIGTGQVLYVDGVQLEQYPYPTPYCDGSMNAVPGQVGHAWTGTPHASASTRVWGGLSFDNVRTMNDTEGALMFWAYADAWDGQYERRSNFARYGLAGSDGFLLRTTAANAADANALQLQYWNGGSVTLTGAAGSLPTSEWVHIAVTWGPGGVKLYQDGQLIGEHTTPLKAASATAWNLGFRNGLDMMNGWMDDFVTVSREVSADEIRAIYGSNAPVFAETSTMGFRTANGLAWADEQGLWAIDSVGNPAFGVSGFDSKSWGGTTLDKGDLLIGRTTGNYIKWDSSAGTITFAGNGSGITSINGGNITAGTITGTQLNATAINGKTITGALIQTAASGQRVLMDYTGIAGIDSTGAEQWKANTSTDSAIVAGAGTVRLDKNGLAFQVPSGAPYTYSETKYLKWGVARVMEQRYNHPSLPSSTLWIGADPAAALPAGGFAVSIVGTSDGTYTNTGEILVGGGGASVSHQLTVLGKLNVVGDSINPANAVINGHLDVGGNLWMGNTGSATIYVPNWFRSYGPTGWYNETYQGGVYMDSTSHVKLYNGKGLLITGSGHSALLDSATLAVGGYNETGNFRLYIKGVGAGNTTYGIVMRNSIGTSRFHIRDDGNENFVFSAWGYGSDRKLKEDFEEIEDDDTKADRIKGHKYHRKEDTTGKMEYGFVAQEVELEYPDLVQDVVYNTETGETIKTIRYNDFIPMLWEQNKRLRQRGKQLAAEVATLRQEGVTLRQRVKALEDKVDAIIARLDKKP